MNGCLRRRKLHLACSKPRQKKKKMYYGRKILLSQMRNRMVTKPIAQRSSLGAIQRRSSLKRKKSEKKISSSIKRIRADMVEISQGQKRIREGQQEVREKFQEISEEASKLKEETILISKQSAANQLRLDLMFQIVKARSENDYAKDASLTQTLRDLMSK